jgi:hypothetical protein
MMIGSNSLHTFLLYLVTFAVVIGENDGFCVTRVIFCILFTNAPAIVDKSSKIDCIEVIDSLEHLAAHFLAVYRQFCG